EDVNPREPSDNGFATLSLNRAALLEAVRWAAGSRLQAEVSAPETVAMALYEQPSGRRLLHLVNYNDQAAVGEIPVSLQVASGKKTSSLVLLSPDGGVKQPLSFKQTGTTLQFTVPKLATYALIVAE